MRNRRKLWRWGIAIVLGVVLLLGAFQLDGAVHHWQQVHRWKRIPQLSRNITRATDWPAHIALALVLIGIAWWRGSQKWTRVFVAMILAAALAGVTAYGVKFSTGRVRPSVKVEQGWRGPDSDPNDQAFPSGHTAASAGFFGVLFFVRWRLGLACFFIPLFVAFTRVFLGAHYFSDVVCGILLGLLAAGLVAQFMLSQERTGEWRGELPRARGG